MPGTSLRDEGTVNGIQRALAPSIAKKNRQISKMIRIASEAGAHIGIGIETGIDNVACSLPPDIP